MCVLSDSLVLCVFVWNFFFFNFAFFCLLLYYELFSRGCVCRDSSYLKNYLGFHFSSPTMIATSTGQASVAEPIHRRSFPASWRHGFTGWPSPPRPAALPSPPAACLKWGRVWSGWRRGLISQTALLGHAHQSRRRVWRGRGRARRR